MKTIQDIMKEHPVAVTQNTNTHIGTTTDLLCRWYNMWWGALTETHMQLMDDGTYLVTGHVLNKETWQCIMYNRRLWSAPNTQLPHTWYDVMVHNHMDFSYSANNGTFAIAMAFQEGFGGTKEIPMATSVAQNSMCNAVC